MIYKQGSVPPQTSIIGSSYGHCCGVWTVLFLFISFIYWFGYTVCVWWYLGQGVSELVRGFSGMLKAVMGRLSYDTIVYTGYK